MFQPGSTVRCTDDRDAPDLCRGQCYKVIEEAQRHLRLEGVDQLRSVDRFQAVWPIREADVIERFPISLPDGEAGGILLRTSSGPSNRRIIVNRGVRLLFDTESNTHLADCENALQGWLAHLMHEKPIPF